MKALSSLLKEVRSCTICNEHLDLGPRPVVQMHSDARILIAGQAPGKKVHQSGIPFDDPSGKRLRQWMGITSEEFYDASKVAILPMGFCYPGTGKSGDLPPRPECAPAWREKLLHHLPKLEMTLVIGQYALKLPHARQWEHSDQIGACLGADLATCGTSTPSQPTQQSLVEDESVVRGRASTSIAGADQRIIGVMNYRGDTVISDRSAAQDSRSNSYTIDQIWKPGRSSDPGSCQGPGLRLT